MNSVIPGCTKTFFLPHRYGMDYSPGWCHDPSSPPSTGTMNDDGWMRGRVDDQSQFCTPAGAVIHTDGLGSTFFCFLVCWSSVSFSFWMASTWLVPVVILVVSFEGYSTPYYPLHHQNGPLPLPHAIAAFCPGPHCLPTTASITYWMPRTWLDGRRIPSSLHSHLTETDSRASGTQYLPLSSQARDGVIILVLPFKLGRDLCVSSSKGLCNSESVSTRIVPEQPGGRDQMSGQVMDLNISCPVDWTRRHDPRTLLLGSSLSLWPCRHHLYHACLLVYCIAA